MKISTIEFGKLEDGTVINQYVLTNDSGVEVKILNYGGVIQSLRTPDRDGNFDDIVLGFSSLEDYTQDMYLKEGFFLGALIGRYGNRIANGKFSLEGKTYSLVTNNGPNHLHGGSKGFDKVVWNGTPFQENGAVGLVLTYTSEDMEEGYPGKLKVKVKYTLTAGDELKIEYEATTDKTTVVNLTNHAYFNLSGKVRNTILGHEMMLNADQFVPTDETSIPTGDLLSVEGTPMDFRNARSIGSKIKESYEQLAFAKGYDHTWVLGANGPLKHGATVYEPESGRSFEMHTTEPGVQFYSGNYLNGKFKGKEKAYDKWDGFCLETQHFPDSPNQPQFPSTILHPGERYTSTTIYKFGVK